MGFCRWVSYLLAGFAVRNPFIYLTMFFVFEGSLAYFGYQRFLEYYPSDGNSSTKKIPSQGVERNWQDPYM